MMRSENGTSPSKPVPAVGEPGIRVGIDLDGVFYNFGASVRHFLHTHYADNPFGNGNYPDPHRWDFFLDWGLTLPEFLRVCNEGVDAGIIFNWGDPFEDSQAAFRQIQMAGHSLHAVTDRSFGTGTASQYATHDWLTRHGLRCDSVTFSSDKTVADVDIYIDDKVENYLALDTAGTEVWLLDRPWNQHLDAERRLSHISEYVQKVEDRRLSMLVPS